ncbi:hypothetical protein TWF694_008433 [Orbilia ellipsospora]|uniref:Uncharacterized protein n=1 Tax=Orbilia ellipsospora TaxID=2528407 RepID=A0AAV9XG25_9PEZI
MYSNISPITAVAILASISQVSAHCRFLGSWGDHDPIKGGALAHLYEFPVKKGGDQYPYQWDVAVFSNPPVPACCASPYVKVPRQWMAQGCGADLHNVFDYWAVADTNGLTPPSLVKSGATLWTHRNYHFFMRPLVDGAMIQFQKEMQKEVAAGRMARVNPGGWLNIVVWQTNDDGAGPFRCRIDETGTSNGFGPWQNVIKQPPGSQKWYSNNPASNSNYYDLRVAIPAGIKCGAKFGQYENVCIMRCENYAKNGPFGGCVPFQVIYPPAAPPPPPPPPAPVHQAPVYGNPGYNVGDGNYKEGTYGGNMKRDEEVQEAVIKRTAADSENSVAVEEQTE